MTTVAPHATYREVFAEPVFRVLFGTRSLAIAADTLRIVALSVLVFTATGSTLLAAMTFGVGFLPQIVGGTLLGALADRLPPRSLITAGYLIECAAATALALLDLPVAASLGLVAVVAALTPVFGGASSRLVAEVLTGDAYVLGRSLSSVASAGAQLLGLAAGGVAVGALGARHALLVSAACHLCAAVAVRLLLPRLPAPGHADNPPGDVLPPSEPAVRDTSSAVRESGSAVRERGSAVRKSGSAVRESWSATVTLLRDDAVRPLLLLQWLPPAFATGAEALIVPYVSIRGFPTGSVGLLLACVPAGMLAADLAVGRLIRPRLRERLVAPLLVLLGLAIIGLSAPVPLAGAAALLVLLGCGFAYALGIQRRFLDALPTRHRGQAFGLLSTGLMTLQGLGPTVFGTVGQLVSIPAALATAGAATLLVAVMLVPKPISADVHSRMNVGG